MSLGDQSPVVRKTRDLRRDGWSGGGSNPCAASALTKRLDLVPWRKILGYMSAHLGRLWNVVRLCACGKEPTELMQREDGGQSHWSRRVKEPEIHAREGNVRARKSNRRRTGSEFKFGVRPTRKLNPYIVNLMARTTGAYDILPPLPRNGLREVMTKHLRLQYRLRDVDCWSD